MKKLFYFFGICLILTSCSPSIYYQMYQTKPMTDDITVNENALVYEDDNCVILYDFWGEYGDFGFQIYNKGAENIYLHLDECFFVANGFAFDYYQNRIFSNTSSSVTSTTSSYTSGYLNSSTYAKGNASAYNIGSTAYGNAFGTSNTYKNSNVYGTSNTYVNSSSKSVTIAEKVMICVPPKTSKIISEFNIRTTIYRDCDIYLYPGNKDKNVLDFSNEDSPYVFGNKLAYSIGDSASLIRINNDFYVSKISNYSVDKVFKTVTKENCGKKLINQYKRVFKESGPDQFYIEYSKDPSYTIEH